MKNVQFLDIIQVDFGNNSIGSEQGGIRPAVVIQNNVGNQYSTSTIVLPLSSKIKNLNQPTHTLLKKDREKGLVKDSVVLAECIRQISEKRILKYLGKITDEKEKKEIKRVYIANIEKECV